MKLTLSLTLVLLSIITVHSQKISPELQSLIDAENNFAKTSKEKSIREAFWNNLDDSSIVFEKGVPVNGREVWSKREPNKFYLFWWPKFADIASSGELGYTTGPCEWGKNKDSLHITGGGYYSTVWRKDKSGRWKIATDLGSGKFDSTEKFTDVVATGSPLKKSPVKMDSPAEKAAFIAMDNDYNKMLNKDGISFSIDYLSDNGRIHRPGEKPFTNRDEFLQNKKIEDGVRFKFGQSAGNISESADLAYAYGKVQFTLVDDGKEQTIDTNYLRVWKKEDGKTWKIVLDVVGP